MAEAKGALTGWEKELGPAAGRSDGRLLAASVRCRVSLAVRNCPLQTWTARNLVFWAKPQKSVCYYGLDLTPHPGRGGQAVQGARSPGRRTQGRGPRCPHKPPSAERTGWRRGASSATTRGSPLPQGSLAAERHTTLLFASGTRLHVPSARSNPFFHYLVCNFLKNLILAFSKRSSLHPHDNAKC